MNADQIAASLIDEYAVLVMAALDGDLDALKALVGAVSATAFHEGARHITEIVYPS